MLVRCARKTNLLLFLGIGLVFLCAEFFTASAGALSKSDFRVSSKKVFNAVSPFMDLHPIGEDFLVTELSDKPSPVHFLRKTGEFEYADQTAKVFSQPVLAQHARHGIFFDLNGDEKKDIIIADHGIDQMPFPGAKPIILMGKDNGWSALPPSVINERTLYTYHVAAFRLAKKNYLYLSNFNFGGNVPELWEFGEKIVNRSDLLPENIHQGKECFMSALAEDFNHDGIPELLLGSCDDQKNAPARDLLLEFKNNKFVPATNPLPLREKNSSWGTAHFEAADFNQDGKMDFLALPHNAKNTQSLLQVFTQVGDLKFKSKTLPYKPAPNSFVVWAAVGDLNGDAFPDISFAIRFKDQKSMVGQQKFHVFLNQEGKSFSDITDVIPLENKLYVGFYFLPLGPKGASLFALDYEGNYFIVQHK